MRHRRAGRRAGLGRGMTFRRGCLRRNAPSSSAGKCRCGQTRAPRPCTKTTRDMQHATRHMQHATDGRTTDNGHIVRCRMQHTTHVMYNTHYPMCTGSTPFSAQRSAVIRMYQCFFAFISAFFALLVLFRIISAVVRRYCYTMQCGAYTGPTPVGAPLFPPERRRTHSDRCMLPADCCLLPAGRCIYYVARCFSLRWSATPSSACRSAA